MDLDDETSPHIALDDTDHDGLPAFMDCFKLKAGKNLVMVSQQAL